ncbi:MAG: ABC transporter substrate-binding protein [Chloroflexi bacterium]|nr:ABC transporter substrate-binding protein [Chloroflexota bacterium]MDA1296571.1 ABC transporter substrate-binding protein [Chloroflexota bacterium]
MDTINLMASRHSAFYSPLISCIAGGFLAKEGLEGTYRPASAGENTGAEVASGRIDVGQSAVSGSWAALEQGKKPAVANFAQINRYDGFIIAAREPDSSFQWSKLRGKKFLHVHGGQPEAMLRFGLNRQGIDLSDLDDIESPGGDEMMRQWRAGQGDYFHEQGAYPQQLEYLGEGHIVASVGEAVGPTAFSSLACRWDWTGSDIAIRFTAAYRASRNWVNTADPMEVAKAEASFFPNMAVEATAAAVAYYQKLGTWSGDIAIEPDLYESALDVFAHSSLITKRQAYGDVVVPPPGS